MSTSQETAVDLTDRQRELKEQWLRVRGAWSDAWEAILRLDPDFFESYLKMSGVPFTRGVLDPKVKEFVYIVADANATHLYEPGARQHIRKALELGATSAEIMEVLECASTVGIHAMTVGVPTLLEVLEEEGLRKPAADFDERQQALKEEFTRSRGYWDELWDVVLDLSPDYFEAYSDFSSVPWRNGVLEPKVREFLYITFDASATHMYLPGLKLHMRNAISYGATEQEIMEVLQIVSTIGIHASTMAAPILLEEIERAKRV